MNNLFSSSATRTASSNLGDFGFREFVETNRSVLALLKSQLVQRLTAEFSDVESHLVWQAVNEADSLASQTVVPHLLLPTLAEEKVHALRNWTTRQRALWRSPGYAPHGLIPSHPT